MSLERPRAMYLVDELRMSSRLLSNYARIVVTTVNRDTEEAYNRLMNIRDGKLPRPKNAMLAPGRLVRMIDLIDEQRLDPMEKELLHKALAQSSALAVIEQRAMTLAGSLTISDLGDPLLRAKAVQAVDLLFGDNYRQQIVAIQELLDSAAANLARRLGAEEDAVHKHIGLLLMGMCVIFLLTSMSFIIVGQAGKGGMTAQDGSLRSYIYILLALMVSLSLPIWFIYNDSRSIMESALEKRQMLICREVYREIFVRTEQALDVARIMGMRPFVQRFVSMENGEGADKESRNAALKGLDTFTSAYSDIGHTLLLNKHGQVLLSTMPEALPGQHFLPPAELERALRGEAFVASITNPAKGVQELVAVAPVLPLLQGRAERADGAVVSVLDRNHSFRLWEDRLSDEERMNIFVVSQNGEVLLSSRGVDRQGKGSSQETAGRMILNNISGLHYYIDSRGIERVGYFLPVPELGCTVGVTSAYAGMTSQIRDMLVRALLFGVAALLLATLCLTLLMQRMIRNLKAAKEQLDGIIDAAEMFTYDYDLLKGTFTHSAQWCRFWHWPGPAEAGVKPISLLAENLHPDSMEEYARLAQRTLGEVFVNEVQIRIGNGEWRWCRQSGRVDACDKNGHPCRVVGAAYDITAQKRQKEMEAAYTQELQSQVSKRTAELEESRQQAEAASQAKTAFLSTVSHEIRTPMNAILGFAHIFDRDNLTDTQKIQLDKIRLSASTLLGVINDVLDISKIEAGKLELEQAPFHLHQTLDTVHSIVEFAASAKGLELSVVMEDNVPALLLGDATRISQILLNLMNNAVKFTQRGYVRLDVGRAEPVDGPPDGLVTLVFRVTDTGIGITPEQMSRLFKPFMQADSSVTRRFGGTGLGLAISKQLVELMGGAISAVSQPGQGSQFHFTLRLALPQEGELTNSEAIALTATEQSAEVLAALNTLRGVRILVVEDNDINQEVARALLEEYGLIVDMAANGQESLSMAESTRYACIFMDMQMPVMGGLEAARRLREMGKNSARAGDSEGMLSWLAQVPIIAMTANAMAEDRQRCLEAGMDDHIGKPIDVHMLQRCLLRWLALPVPEAKLR